VLQLLALHPEGGELRAFLPRFPEGPQRPHKQRAAIASTLLAALELAEAVEALVE
jgi:hypothetical protein